MVRPIAQKMYDALMTDNFGILTPACYCDFELGHYPEDQIERFWALQNAVRKGATVEDLDAVLGDGNKITALVRKYGCDVVFPFYGIEDIEELN